MSKTDFDKFNLEGLSLEETEPVKSKKLESVEQAEKIVPVEQPVKAAANDEDAEKTENLMTCPKCELEQPKAEQCSRCGVYVQKAMAQIGQSKIEITSTKF